jgi:hypothetical protein
VTMAAQVLVGPTASSGVGFGWRQSSDGKLVALGYGRTSTEGCFEGWKMNTATTWSGTTYFSHCVVNRSDIVWFRAIDNGTNRLVCWSPSGLAWQQIHSVGRTDFMTADQVGFYANALSATWLVGIRVVSWKEDASDLGCD